MITLQGHIVKTKEGEGFYTFTPYHNTYMLERDRITDVETVIVDQRELSPVQRNKIFALIRDITEWVSGFDQRKFAFNETLTTMQLNYLIEISPETLRWQLTQNYCRLCGIDLFSLSARSADTIDMTTARDFIDWLVELCIVNGIPCMDTLLNRCEDIGRYLYACLANKRCALCGGKAELHHVDAVGAGRNRKDIIHEGMCVLPLCRKHHTEAHTIGRKTFCDKYHTCGIKLDSRLCRLLKVKAAPLDSTQV